MIRLNSRGMALPFVLGIVVVLFGIVLTLTTYVVNQTKLIETDYEYREDYVNAQETIEAAVQVLMSQGDFSSSYLNDLSTYMDIDISIYNENTWILSRDISLDRTVVSYLSSLSQSLDLMSSLFAYDGLENGFELNPLITPSALLDEHMSEFYQNTFPSVNYTGGFTSIDDIVSYIDSLTSSGTSYIKVNPTILSNQSNPTVNGHWFVNGNLTIPDNRNLVIPSNYILFVDGSLTMKQNSTLYGNVVVNGTVDIASKKTNATINATIYTSGNMLSDDNIYLGTSSRPSFVFSEGDVIYKKKAIGYGFFLCDRFQVNRRSTTIDITGGVYSNSLSNLDDYEIQPFAGLNPNNMYSFAVPTDLYVSEASGNGYAYTKPR